MRLSLVSNVDYVFYCHELVHRFVRRNESSLVSSDFTEGGRHPRSKLLKNKKLHLYATHILIVDIYFVRVAERNYLYTVTNIFIRVVSYLPKVRIVTIKNVNDFIYTYIESRRW